MMLIAEAEKYDVRRGPFSSLTVNAKLYQSDAQRYEDYLAGFDADRAAVRLAEFYAEDE